jgi:hypothetical protein
MRAGRVCAAGLLVVACGASPARAQFRALETDDLRLVYFHPSETFLAPHVARSFANSMRFHRALFGYRPSEKVTVLLTDFSDFGNAGATSVPRPSVNVRIAPLSFAFETFAANERMNTLMNHELVHVVAMDQAARSERVFRRLFGGTVSPIADHPASILYFYLTAPRVAAPRWYHEGIAVFLDTWMAGGIGRAQGAYDEMVFRSMVRDGSRFYDPLGLASEGTKIDFQLQVNSYLYGTRFMTWLADRHGPESLVRWVSRADGSRAYYASAFRQIYGQTIERSWAEWIAAEREFQRANLESIRKYPVTPHTDLSARALGSVSRAHLDAEAGKIYAAFNYPGVVAHLGAISTTTGAVERITDIKGPSLYTVTSVAWDQATRTLFYTTDNNAYRDLMAVDPRTKRPRMLLKDARIGDLAFSPADRALWGIRHYNGICTLVRLMPPYDEWQSMHSWPYGEVAYDLDVSPDGRRVSASLGEINGRNTLRVMEVEQLTRDQAPFLAEVEFGTSIPSGFVFSPDGRYLYGSSYYTGVSNIFRYEIATRDLRAVSNGETGFFRPVPMDQDRLLVFRYSGEGFVPAVIEARPLEDVSAIRFLGQQVVERHPVLKQWMVGSPASISLEGASESVYRPTRGLRLESAFPILTGYKDTAAVGWRFNFSDHLQLNRASVEGSVSPGGGLEGNERVHLSASYFHDNWTARARYNFADFYDLFGPTKVSRKGYALGLSYDKPLVYDLPRQMELEVSATLYGALDTLPDFQNVPAPVTSLFTTRARLGYQNLRGSLGSVDDEKGHRWEVVGLNDLVTGKAYPKLYGVLDVGRPLPLGHSSVWLRTTAGVSAQDRDDPFANFYFGGFGNNWVDHGDEKRYRHPYSFPGLEIDERSGRNFVKSMLEWNLPPLRFRRVGTPGLYATWARASLFAALLATNLEAAEARRTVSDVGLQVDVRLSLLSALDMTVSFGQAVAFESGRPPRHEFMASLKILR